MCVCILTILYGTFIGTLVGISCVLGTLVYYINSVPLYNIDIPSLRTTNSQQR